MAEHGCRREVLARGPGCQVETCSCGTVHLTIGCFTARLERADWEAISPTLVEAVCAGALRGELARRAARPARPSRLEGRAGWAPPSSLN